MADDWGTLSGTAHQFLDPTYQMVVVLLEDLLQRPALDELDSQVDLMDVDWEDDWQDFAIHYHGYLACLAVSVVLLVTLLIGGIIFCCCRCCPCCCGCRCCCCGHKQPGKSGKLSTGQLCCALLFFIVLGAMSMGVVIMFVANPLVDDEVKDRTLYNHVNDTVNDVQGFIDRTIAEITDTTLEMYRNVQENVLRALNSIPSIAMAVIETATGAKGLLSKQREFFEVITEDSMQIDDTTDSLEEDASYLDEELEELRNNISTLVPACGVIPTCNATLRALVTSVDYSMLFNFSDVREASTTTEDLIRETEQGVDDIEVYLEEQLESAIQDVEEALNAGYDGLSIFLYNITGIVDLGLVEKVNDLEDNDIRTAIEDYWSVWFYCMMGISVVLALIVVLYLLGLFCGLCGKRPREGGCCNRSSASCLLMASVYLLLVFSVLVVAVSVVLLVLGGLLHTEICRYFGEPVEYKPSLDTIDKIIVSHTDVSVNIINAINTCDKGYTLYTALGLDDLDDIDLDETLDPGSYGIPEALLELANIDVTIGDVSLLQPATLVYTAIVNETLRGKDYQLYTDVMTDDVTEGDLHESADTLEQYAGLSSDEDEFRKCVDRMRELGDHVIKMEAKQVTVIHSLQHMLDTTADDPMDDQLVELRTTENDLNNNGDTLVKNVLVNVTSFTLDALYSSAKDIGDSIRYRVGDCGPLHTATYGLLGYVCVDILYPLNAFWFGMGWFLTFSFISMFTACSLAGVFAADDATAAAPKSYSSSRRRRAGTYAPSGDLYMDYMTLNLPDASFQPRDRHDPILVSFIGKTGEHKSPVMKTTNLADCNGNDYKYQY